MASLHLEVVTPEKVVVSEKVDSVAAPGTLGQFGVLPGHTSLLTGIVPGEVHWRIGDREVLLSVTTGFAEVAGDKVSILVDAAERIDEIDVERAREAMNRAKKRLSGEMKKESVDFARAEGALNRAVARIRVAEKRP
ncbi:MAG TPA: F0F1 ATP synthase subunit epsilon [Desulfobacteraceae bacterium]|nr:F0F1 ATP synthase subunit epsilon [Desulfobacteraceae bacterium]